MGYYKTNLTFNLSTTSAFHKLLREQLEHFLLDGILLNHLDSGFAIELLILEILNKLKVKLNNKRRGRKTRKHTGMQA